LVSVNVVSEKHLLHVSHAWRLPLWAFMRRAQHDG
jgi:hypothetical protein